MISSAIHVVQALGVLTLLMLGVVAVQRKLSSFDHPMLRNAIIGTLFGLVIVIVMLDPIKLSVGGTFDPRGGPAILAGVFAGPAGALVAALIGSAARMYLVGGPYALGGVVGFALYGLFGCIAGTLIKRYSVQIGPVMLLGLGALGSVAVIPSFFISANFDAGLKILWNAGPLLLINNIIGTFIVGMFIAQANRWQKIAQQLETEQAENLRLARLAQNTTNGIVVTDEFGITEWVNKSFEDVTGFSLGEVTGQRLGDILQGPDSDLDAIEEMSLKIKQREGFDVTIINYHKNGQPFWIHIKCHTFLDVDGALKFMAVETDVSEQVAAQQKLRKSESRFKDFAESSSDWLWEMDADSRVTFVSDRIETSTGYPASSFVGKTREELTGEDYFTDKWAAMRGAIKARTPIKDFQYSRSDTNGAVRYISIHGTPFYDEKGVFMGYRGTGSDITEQRAIYDRAIEAEQKLLTAIDSLEDGFVLFDAEDRLVLCNDKYREIYNLSNDLLVPGNKFEDIVRAAADRGQYFIEPDQMENWITERIADHSQEHRIFEKEMPNGQWLKISESATPQGGIVGFHVDITQLKIAQQSAEAANLSKSNFLSRMSHEIRTPMNGVLGLAQLLTDTNLNKDQREKVNTLLSSGQTLLAIINDVLDMSKIEAGGVELENHPFSLKNLISTIASPFQSLADDKGLKLKVTSEIDSDLVVKGDAVRLRQIFWNLLSNAIKFTSEGSIDLTISQRSEPMAGVSQMKDRLICFTTKDTGSGIASDRIDAIFDPFTQEDNSISRKFGGTGLGLSIVKQLTELMGGKILVSSTIGEGTVIDIYIPFEDASPDESEFVSLRKVQSPLQKAIPLKVLIAEDNDVNAMIARSFLEKFGHEVRHAVNGRLVVEAAKEGWADLILMDIHMPEMDGIDATKEIRKTEIGKNLPIVGLTAEAFTERHAVFIDAGMNGVLTKPFTEQQLAETLAIYRDEDRRLTDRETNPGTAPQENYVITKESKMAIDGLEMPIAGAAKEPEGKPAGNAEKLQELRQQLPSDVVSTLLQQAQETMQGQLSELKQAVENEDSEQIREMAHSIKGVSSSMFCQALSDLAATIEQNATDLALVRGAMPAFEVAVLSALEWWHEQVGD